MNLCFCSFGWFWALAQYVTKKRNLGTTFSPAFSWGYHGNRSAVRPDLHFADEDQIEGSIWKIDLFQKTLINWCIRISVHKKETQYYFNGLSQNCSNWHIALYCQPTWKFVKRRQRGWWSQEQVKVQRWLACCESWPSSEKLWIELRVAGQS